MYKPPEYNPPSRRCQPEPMPYNFLEREEERMAEWASLRAKVIALKGIPLSLFGYSLIRAWISLLYANPVLSGGGQGVGYHFL